MENIAQKTKYKNKNTPTKRLISMVISRYAAAHVKERQAIVEFFNWAVRNSYNPQLQGFYVEVRAQVLEVQS